MLFRQAVAWDGSYGDNEPLGTLESLQAGRLSQVLELEPGGLRYMVFLPRAWRKPDAGGGGAEDKHPTILFLHGAGSMNNHVNLRNQSIVRRVSELEDMPFIVILPITPAKGGWEPWLNATMRLLDSLLGGLGGDPLRVYVLGQSMGGHGAWLLAAAHADRFAAVVPVCAHLRLSELRRVTESLATKPAWAFHAVDDSVIPVHHSDRAVQALQKQGSPIKYTRYQTAPPSIRESDSVRVLQPGHASYELAFSDPALYAWLLTQSLAPLWGSRALEL